MWNELKSNFTSALVFFREFILFNFLLIIIILILVDTPSLSISLILILLFISLITLNLIGARRRKELNKIKDIITNISKNIYADPDEIILSRNLSGLEDAIKGMFEKAKSDIEYLKRLERIRTEFLANVSHELRTPIFTIQGYLETLLNGAINDKNVNLNFLEKANHHTINLSNLLNDLIDISMIESGEMRMSYRYFDVHPYMSQIIQELKPMAAEKSIELLYSFQADEKLQLFGDKNKLRQAFINLIQNAIKYTEHGKVEVIIEEEKKHGLILIKDTGIGIPEQDINRIFERFYRVDKARSKAVGGTGLGLAIVKHIIEAHGSKIDVKSKINEGSEFSFRLKK
ncbi:MAG: ATP-binding protein [Ignavibacterium sp.]|nr:ATP-binding protein [Ignavibacterium sp.]